MSGTQLPSDTPKASSGRPTKFSQEMVDRAHDLYLAGKTDAQVAEELGVVVSTIFLWAQEHPAFSEARRAWKLAADEKVERSLWERANGYSHPAVKIHVASDGKVTEVQYTEHYPPDATSMIFWLKNRKPKDWRDKQEHELSGPNGGPIVSATITTDDPAEAARAYQRIISGESE